MLSIGIVGAGIGGLTLALALREAGCGDVRVYECGEPGAAGNASLVLSPNGSRVLHALGLKDDLQSHCGHPQVQLQRTWRSGFLVAQRPLGRFAEDRYGAPHCIIAHARLLHMLLDACSTRGIEVTGHRNCIRLTHSNAGPTLVFDPVGADPVRDPSHPENAHHTAHDVIIGCDGTASVVRDYLNYPGANRLDATVWQGAAPLDSVHRAMTTNHITGWLGPGRSFTHWLSPDSRRVEYLAITPNDGSNLAAQFAAWHSNLRDLIDAGEAIATGSASEHEPIAQWHDGRVALLGDACHALPPQLQQGAAMAMEDAWVLSRMLERWEDEPATGFDEYQRYRKVRITRVRRAGRAVADEWSERSPRRRWVRIFRQSMASRFLPEMSLQQLDWLYGYDCIHGFE